MLETSIHTKELGRLKYGKPTSFTFSVKNTGSNQLEINKLVVGCGSCTKATVPKTTLQPNEEVDVKVVFTPGSTGKQTKYISVRYDDSKVLRLEFTADVYA